MNQRDFDQIDEIFKDRLDGVQMDPPMHIWNAIVQKRNSKYLFWLGVKRNWMLISSIGLVALLGAVAYFSALSSFVEIQSLPIPLNIEKHHLTPSSKKNEFTPASNIPLAETSTAPTNSNSNSPKKDKINTAQALNLPKALTNDKPSEIIFNTQSIDFQANSFPALPGGEDLQGISIEKIPAQIITEIAFSNRPEEILAMSFQEPLAPKILPNKTKPVFSLEAVGGSFKTYRKLEAFSDEYEQYLNERKNSEKVRPGISGGLQFLLRLPNGITLKSGIHYTQINEQFEYFDKIKDRFTIINVTDPGSVVPRADTIYETQLQVTQNKLRTLDLPLLIGMHKQYKSFSFGVFAGGYINLLFKPKGTIIGFADFKPISVVGNDPVFKDKVGVSWYGNLDFAYEFRSGFHFTLQPYVRFFPSYFNDPDYVINQQYLNTGLVAGIRKTF